MATSPTHAPGRLLQYLPAIYQADPFIGQFLAAFEKVLLGREDDVDAPSRGLEEIIAGLDTFFDPTQTPKEFLSWLSGWTALGLRADLDEAKQRDFIANIIQLYRWRGTKKNLQDLLAIFTIATPTIVEDLPQFQIGVRSTIGQDTYLDRPHFFVVTISLPKSLQNQPQELARQMEIASALIDLEKPAHTFYRLDVIYPSMQIGVASTVGVDTLLVSSTSNKGG
jgi:phage tail-like protein